MDQNKKKGYDPEMTLDDTIITEAMHSSDDENDVNTKLLLNESADMEFDSLSKKNSTASSSSGSSTLFGKPSTNKHLSDSEK